MGTAHARLCPPYELFRFGRRHREDRTDNQRGEHHVAEINTREILREYDKGRSIAGAALFCVRS